MQFPSYRDEWARLSPLPMFGGCPGLAGTILQFGDRERMERMGLRTLASLPDVNSAGSKQIPWLTGRAHNLSTAPTPEWNDPPCVAAYA